MPRLKNPFHEKAAHLLIKNKWNKTQTYLEQHPNASYATAAKNAGRYMERNGIVNRALEICSQHQKLSLESILDNLADCLKAKKMNVIKGQKHYEPDYAVRLETSKFLLQKIYGIGNIDTVVDSRSIHFHQQDQASCRYAPSV